MYVTKRQAIPTPLAREIDPITTFSSDVQAIQSQNQHSMA